MSDPSRYHRQMILPGFGPEAQDRLARATVAIVGCGALGTVAADHLARAGVGTIRIVDRDLVEWTNLQRQVLFTEDDARNAAPKAEAAAARLAAVNSDIRVEPIVADLNPRSAERVLLGSAVVIDGTDNFQTRYLLNDVCVKHAIPLVYGGVVGTRGMAMTIVPGATPCLRCVFPDPPDLSAGGVQETCDTAGVLAPMAGVVASLQASEAMKILVGRTDLVRADLSEFDLWNNRRRTIGLSRLLSTECPCCTKRRFDFLDAPARDTLSLCGADAVQVLPAGAAGATLDLEAFAARMRTAGYDDFQATRFLARGRVERLGLTVFSDARAIIRGTTDFGRARSVYARYVGS